MGMFQAEPALVADQPRQTVIGDKNYFAREFEERLIDARIRLLRPARKDESERPGSLLFKPLRQIIESINQTLKGPTRPRTPRRTHHRGRHGPRPATHPRIDRGDLAQPPKPADPSSDH